jgi:hypothetical protein
MSRQKQLGFEVLGLKKVKTSFGGSLLKGNPKTKRPVTSKKCMHLVMRSQLAHGRLSLFRFEKQIEKIILTQGRNFGVKVYRQANAGNHLHLAVLPRSRNAYNGFIRSISGLIARLVLKAERSNPKGIRFWEKRPFTEIVEWGKQFKTLSNYLMQNTLEALGFIPYQPRRAHTKRLSLSG